MSFGYAMQKFGEARRALMLPHWEGPTRAIVMAGFYARAGVDALSSEDVEDNLACQLELVKQHLAKGDIQNPHEVAAEMTDDEVRSLASAIDELADYAHRRFWSNAG